VARQLRQEQITQAEKASRDREQRVEKPAEELKMEQDQRASLDRSTKTERRALKKHERVKTRLRDCRKSKHHDVEASFHRWVRKRIKEASV
jgi:hypothetical protein